MCADFFFHFQMDFLKMDKNKCPISENTFKKVKKNRHVFTRLELIRAKFLIQ